MHARLTAAALMVLLLQPRAHADVVYSSVPSAVPPNVASLGYEGTGTSQFGDAVALAGTARLLTGATVLISSWALESSYERLGSSAGYVAPLTLSFYAFGSPGPNPAVGPLIASDTVDAFIPWRPEATPASCAAGDYLAGNGHCYSGVAAPISFTYGGALLPDTVIFGLSFNTKDFGAAPTHVAGPIDTLKFGFSTAATVGTDVNPDGLEINTADGTFLTTGVAGVFGPDTGWAGTVPAATIYAAVPEPAGIVVLLPAAFGMLVRRRRHHVTVKSLAMTPTMQR